jgi:hypothetical protein
VQLTDDVFSIITSATRSLVCQAAHQPRSEWVLRHCGPSKSAVRDLRKWTSAPFLWRIE